jgi:hypothetical protein
MIDAGSALMGAAALVGLTAAVTSVLSYHAGWRDCETERDAEARRRLAEVDAEEARAQMQLPIMLEEWD